MNVALDKRIDDMLRRDILVGILFAALMWIVLIFTLITAVGVIDDAAVTVVITIACLVLGTFNTLSLLSLVRRYKAERMHVYGEDIHYLDAARAAKTVEKVKAG